VDIGSALDRIIAIQGGLSITSPITESIKVAYKYSPAANVGLPDAPAFFNEWTLEREERHVSMRIQYYTVHMQLLVRDADLNRAADIATAFHVALVDAFDADVQMNNTVTQSSLRGGSPTLAGFVRNNINYIGLDLFLDLELKEAKSFS